MIRVMKNDEKRNVKVVNRHITIPVNPIITAFSTVKRKLTISEIRLCLMSGAYVYDITGDTTRQLDLNNYNKSFSSVTVDTVTVPNQQIKTEEKPKVVEDSETKKEIELQNEAPDEEDVSLVM